MGNLLEETRVLMPGRARSHWNLDEQEYEDDLMRAHKRAGDAIHKVLGGRYSPVGSAWSTSAGWEVADKLIHLEVGGNWLPRPGHYYVYFRFVGPSFDRSEELEDMLRKAKKVTAGKLARVLKRYGDVERTQMGRGMVVTGVGVPEDKIQDFIKKLPSISTSWARAVKKAVEGVREDDQGPGHDYALGYPMTTGKRKVGKERKRKPVSEGEDSFLHPYGSGMWVVRVEDFLKKFTKKQWRWDQRPTKDKGAVRYKWKSKGKPRGALTQPAFVVWVKYNKGKDLYDVESAYMDHNGQVKASKTLHGLYRDQVTDPKTLFGWAQRKWHPKTGINESIVGAPQPFVDQQGFEDWKDEIVDQIRRPSWTYPSWALPQEDLSEALTDNKLRAAIWKRVPPDSKSGKKRDKSREIMMTGPAAKEFGVRRYSTVKLDELEGDELRKLAKAVGALK